MVPIIFCTRTRTWDWHTVHHVFSDNAYQLPDDMRGDIFVDIGAHVGGASIRAAWAGADRVIAYEPSSASFYCLAENISCNLFENKIQAYNKAVGPKGKATLIVDTCNTGQSTCLPERNDFGGVDMEEVDMVPLSEVLESVENCYLKMDCEGGEVKIIPEIINGLYKKIHTIVMEFHFKNSMFEQIGELLKYYDAKQLSEWEYKFIRK